MWIQYGLVLLGFVLLYYGAEWLVKGSSNLARSLGVTPLVIGLTVVAFGTSAPELVVSVVASIQGKSMIAVGNVVGSNICNIALILGLAAFLMPITSDKSVVRRDIPLMLAISVYLLLISMNSTIGRLEGVTLFAGVIVYTIYNYRISKKTSTVVLVAENGTTVTAELPDGGAELSDIGIVESKTKQVLLIIVGIAGVIVGAQVLIDAVHNRHEGVWCQRKIYRADHRGLWDLLAGTGHLGCRSDEKRDGHQHRKPDRKQCVQYPQRDWIGRHGKADHDSRRIF